MAPSRGPQSMSPPHAFELPDPDTPESETPTLEQNQYFGSSATSIMDGDGDDPNDLEDSEGDSAASGSDAETEETHLPRKGMLHHSSSSLLMSNDFVPPFYNRPPTPLPPSPSLTSLLSLPRPSFSATPSRPSTPEGSDLDTPHDTESAVTRSNRITTLPRASPKVPTYEYHGFVLYLLSWAAFGLYLLWSYLPEPFLQKLHIYYYPNRWWSLAIPAFLVMTIVYIYVALASYNTGYLTLPIKSIENIVDEAACVAVLDGKGGMHNRRSLGRRTQVATSSPYDMDWKIVWSEGTDAVMDVPIGGVCEILYGARSDSEE